MPGETVTVHDGHVYIDGRVLNESYLPAGTVTDCTAFGPSCSPSRPLGNDEYWVLGDNRGMSKDSRYFGPIHKSDVIIVANHIIWPLDRMRSLPST